MPAAASNASPTNNNGDRTAPVAATPKPTAAVAVALTTKAVTIAAVASAAVAAAMHFNRKL
ncbi:hypothetical protein AXF37_08910 [Legionella pneumophila subsp. pascullei]|nr:hypothetical protein AXF37_08910 [Legionella pneumophila subsp. pascullei]